MDHQGSKHVYYKENGSMTEFREMGRNQQRKLEAAISEVGVC